MKLEVDINVKEITELFTREIVKQILTERTYDNREARRGISDGVDKAIKQYVYTNKDKIIDRVVERASIEIVKKGLPKLLEKLI